MEIIGWYLLVWAVIILIDRPSIALFLAFHIILGMVCLLVLALDGVYQIAITSSQFWLGF